MIVEIEQETYVRALYLMMTVCGQAASIPPPSWAHKKMFKPDIYFCKAHPTGDPFSKAHPMLRKEEKRRDKRVKFTRTIADTNTTKSIASKGGEKEEAQFEAALCGAISYKQGHIPQHLSIQSTGGKTHIQTPHHANWPCCPNSVARGCSCS
jgi:hypothetical protein